MEYQGSIPGRTKIISVRYRVQTGSEAQRAMGTGGGGKAAGA
jgi:hypothetical protein